ncbi:MAG: Methyltransferase domain [Deltaproteobacteria bacterium]|nr:Methyltransferase domain [Deltaproteobacteria bacterium]
MENVQTEWSNLFSYRDRVHKRFPEVWDIPLIKKRSHLLRDILRDGINLLDVGAGMKGMKTEIEGLGFKVTYKSMDVDSSNTHDYYDVNAIQEKFDAILMFEVIEHMSLQEGLDLLKKLYAMTNDRGIIVISTFYAYDELCGLLNIAGFNVKDVYRSYNDAFHRYLLKVYFLGWLFRFLGIDYAYSIFVVGEKQ